VVNQKGEKQREARTCKQAGRKRLRTVRHECVWGADVRVANWMRSDLVGIRVRFNPKRCELMQNGCDSGCPFRERVASPGCRVQDRHVQTPSICLCRGLSRLGSRLPARQATPWAGPCCWSVRSNLSYLRHNDRS
jgi:hypothetical protein